MKKMQSIGNCNRETIIKQHLKGGVIPRLNCYKRYAINRGKGIERSNKRMTCKIVVTYCNAGAKGTEEISEIMLISNTNKLCSEPY